jgi:16S rRNA (guanine966-N2)-methyltransferase
MTRIVGGQAGGRLLQVPANGTRPTSDRVREALFSSLVSLTELTGARVLDLFAGTGAVGLEALSRGAKQATLVDSGRAAVTALQQNASALALPGVAVVARRVETYLSSPAGEHFDVVFADPPYDYPGEGLDTLVAQLADGWLAPGAVVVLERSARDVAPQWPSVIHPVQNRRYGDSVLWYGRFDQRD